MPRNRLRIPSFVPPNRVEAKKPWARWLVLAACILTIVDGTIDIDDGIGALEQPAQAIPGFDPARITWGALMVLTSSFMVVVLESIRLHSSRKFVIIWGTFYALFPGMCELISTIWQVVFFHGEALGNFLKENCLESYQGSFPFMTAQQMNQECITYMYWAVGLYLAEVKYFALRTAGQFVLGFGVLYWAYSVAKELKPTGATGREDPERDIDAIQLPNHAWSDQLSPLPNDLHDYTAKFNMPQHISAGVPRIAE